MLSNLGRLNAVPGGVREVWFSPAGRIPLGSPWAPPPSGAGFLALRYRDVPLPADRKPQATPA